MHFVLEINVEGFLVDTFGYLTLVQCFLAIYEAVFHSPQGYPSNHPVTAKIKGEHKLFKFSLCSLFFIGLPLFSVHHPLQSPSICVLCLAMSSLYPSSLQSLFLALPFCPQSDPDKCHWVKSLLPWVRPESNIGQRILLWDN